MWLPSGVAVLAKEDPPLPAHCALLENHMGMLNP